MTGQLLSNTTDTLSVNSASYSDQVALQGISRPCYQREKDRAPVVAPPKNRIPHAYLRVPYEHRISFNCSTTTLENFKKAHVGRFSRIFQK